MNFLDKETLDRYEKLLDKHYPLSVEVSRKMIGQLKAAQEENERLKAERDDWKQCAEINHAAMQGSVIRLRLTLAECAGDEPPNIPNAPTPFENIKQVAAATTAYNKLQSQPPST